MPYGTFLTLLDWCKRLFSAQLSVWIALLVRQGWHSKNPENAQWHILTHHQQDFRLPLHGVEVGNEKELEWNQTVF